MQTERRGTPSFRTASLGDWKGGKAGKWKRAVRKNRWVPWATQQWRQRDVKETRLHNSQPWATNTKIQRRRAGQGIQYKLKSLRELGISLAVAVLPEPETNPTQGGRPELQPPPRPRVSCDAMEGPAVPPTQRAARLSTGGVEGGPTCADGPSHAPCSKWPSPIRESRPVCPGAPVCAWGLGGAARLSCPV